MTRCIAYRQVVPWEKRCTKKEEETGIKPSYCLFDGDYEKCRFVESVMKYRDLEREGKEMIETVESFEKRINQIHDVAANESMRVCKCGGKPGIKQSESKKYYVRCKECGRGTITCKTPEEAVAIWNNDRIVPNVTSDHFDFIKDSGERREFETGAVRDMSEGKGLMVVMPASALLRLSRHYEHGAKKYGRFNWQKGIPVSSFMDSALRHIMKYLDGWDDEDHLSAAAFNILGAMEMEAHKPEMQDIPAREGKQTFNYKGDEQ